MPTIRPLLVTFGGLALLTGLAYPLAMTGCGRILFPHRTAGSLLLRRGQVVGSELIGQHTEDPRCFWGRLSPTASFPTNASASGGSNLAPSNPALRQTVLARLEALRAADPGASGEVPADLVTASGSGLDPHISPAAALYQVPRVARLRGLPEDRVRELVARHTTPRRLGFLGEPCVNVLTLNLALDETP